MSQLYANNGDIANVDKMIVEATSADLKPGKIEIITYALLVCLSVCISVSLSTCFFITLLAYLCGEHQLKTDAHVLSIMLVRSIPF